MLYIKIGFLAGIFIASPLILWQVWKFIAPGSLHATRRSSRFRSSLMSTIFFVAGGLFAHYVAFPVTWQFFNSFSTDYMVFMPKIDEAFSLYTKMLLGFGVIFEMPTLVFFLARMGVVSGADAASSTSSTPFLVIFIIAAVISPGTDMMSQIVMAVPMLGLYIISIAIAFIFQKRRPPQQTENGIACNATISDFDRPCVTHSSTVDTCRGVAMRQIRIPWQHDPGSRPRPALAQTPAPSRSRRDRRRPRRGDRYAPGDDDVHGRHGAVGRADGRGAAGNKWSVSAYRVNFDDNQGFTRRVELAGDLRLRRAATARRSSGRSWW